MSSKEDAKDQAGEAKKSHRHKKIRFMKSWNTFRNLVKDVEKQWTTHILDYKERYRATMLLNHLDSKVSERIIGLENDYDQARAALDRYYNNRSKIVAACMREVKALPNIALL